MREQFARNENRIRTLEQMVEDMTAELARKPSTRKPNRRSQTSTSTPRRIKEEETMCVIKAEAETISDVKPKEELVLAEKKPVNLCS